MEIAINTVLIVYVRFIEMCGSLIVYTQFGCITIMKA